MEQLTLTQVAERFGTGTVLADNGGLVWPTGHDGWTIEAAPDPESGVQLTLRHRRGGEPCPACDGGSGVAVATALNLEAVPVVFDALLLALGVHVSACDAEDEGLPLSA